MNEKKNVSFDNSDKKRHFALKDKLSKMTTSFQPANKNSRSALGGKYSARYKI